MLPSIEGFYKDFFGISAPFTHQTCLWERIREGRFPILVKAPTGSGKTEAVLAPFLAQFQERRFSIAPRLIYVLPMRVLVNQIAERIRNYAQKISPHITVEIQHGDVPNAPFFIADIVVTTLDQFLYGLARASQQVGRHIDIPTGSIASSIVVFDEAHMYRDGFTFSIMRALMEILHKSKVPFIVMTATMPRTLEESLFENIQLNDDQKVSGNVTSNSKIEIKINKDPLYSSDGVNISDELLEKIKNNKTLIILNQVKRAQEVYDWIKDQLNLNEDEIVLLHSRFTKSDRQAHEKKALSLIPHKGEIVSLEGRGVVISTQVLEAGIDFSAKLLLTELAPADSLIQRAGRCARYEGESGEVIIFPVEKNNNGHLPYEESHLTETLNWLQENTDFNIKDFSRVCSFVDATLDYRAEDYEARDTLIDLYECVLYADTEPRNIQVRKSKPVTLVVLDIPEESGGRVEDRIKEIITNKDILRDNAIDVDTRIAWSLFKDENRPIQWEIQWEYDPRKESYGISLINLLNGKKKKKEEEEEKKKRKRKRKEEEEDARIGPFRTYIFDKKYYTQDKGICRDVSYFI